MPLHELELIIIVVIVSGLIFGGKRLPEIGQVIREMMVNELWRRLR